MMKAVDGKFCSLRVYLHYNVSMDMLRNIERLPVKPVKQEKERGRRRHELLRVCPFLTMLELYCVTIAGA